MAFGEDGGHSDEMAELRHSILAGVRREVRSIAARRGEDLGGQSTAPLNYLGGLAALDAAFAEGFATGYDGSATTVPFLVGISIVGGTDIVTGS